MEKYIMFTIGLKEGTFSDKWLFSLVKWQNNRADSTDSTLMWKIQEGRISQPNTQKGSLYTIVPWYLQETGSKSPCRYQNTWMLKSHIQIGIVQWPSVYLVLHQQIQLTRDGNFHPQLVESADVKPRNTKGWLYIYWKNSSYKWAQAIQTPCYSRANCSWKPLSPCLVLTQRPKNEPNLIAKQKQQHSTAEMMTLLPCAKQMQTLVSIT